ncbi:hypothetical protein TNIN_247231 [Trichonephila inaurata madagascariensis]|uniref:Uncharacterized protein n=1 Tax=Trichonephila inaurata madagascariensis TaxID=2747483 RepID=A0A8X6YEW2_9ARAC|nr:hypothetical protein TNIN_247231 [Trichonephila inaurata madagascariensis]
MGSRTRRIPSIPKKKAQARVMRKSRISSNGSVTAYVFVSKSNIKSLERLEGGFNGAHTLLLCLLNMSSYVKIASSTREGMLQILAAVCPVQYKP